MTCHLAEAIRAINPLVQLTAASTPPRCTRLRDHTFAESQCRGSSCYSAPSPNVTSEVLNKPVKCLPCNVALRTTRSRSSRKTIVWHAAAFSANGVVHPLTGNALVANNRVSFVNGHHLDIVRKRSPYAPSCCNPHPAGRRWGEPEQRDDRLTIEKRPLAYQCNRNRIRIRLCRDVTREAIHTLTDALEGAPTRVLYQLVVRHTYRARLQGGDETVVVSSQPIYVIELRHVKSITNS